MSRVEFSPLQNDAACELLNLGMGPATAMLSKMMKTDVAIGIPQLHISDRIELQRNIPNGVISAVVLPFKGVCGGDSLLLLDRLSTGKMIELYLKNSIPGAHFLNSISREMEIDAMTEIGNIINHACINTMMSQLHIQCSTSEAFYTEGSLEQILESLNFSEEGILDMDIEYSFYKENISGNFHFLMDECSLKTFKTELEHWVRSLTTIDPLLYAVG